MLRFQRSQFHRSRSSYHKAEECNDIHCLQHAVPRRASERYFDWRGWTYRICSVAFAVPTLLLICWIITPNSGFSRAVWRESNPPESVDLSGPLDSAVEDQNCGVQIPEIYVPPTKVNGYYPVGSFCRDRGSLLEALSGGGRHGFDIPYTPKGCHYRWLSPAEICMILERFSSLVFIGDSTLEPIYAGLNMLLRRDPSSGALNTALMPAKDLASCRCDAQFTRQFCASKHILSSTQVTPGDSRPYLYARIPHSFLNVHPGTQFQPDMVDALKALIPRAPASNYHKIPVITAFGMNEFSPASSTTDATTSLSQILDFTASTGRKTPVLWIGPTAPGHLDVRRSLKPGDVWRFGDEMARVVNGKGKGLEAMGMWNMSMQASSWDGKSFGVRVALTQAMMVVNWLAKLEST